MCLENELTSEKRCIRRYENKKSVESTLYNVHYTMNIYLATIVDYIIHFMYLLFHHKFH